MMCREAPDPRRYLLRSELRMGEFYRDRLSGKEVMVCMARERGNGGPPIVTIRVFVEGVGYTEHHVSDHQLWGLPPNRS